MVSDLLEEKEELLREVEQLKQRNSELAGQKARLEKKIAEVLKMQIMTE